VKNDHRFNQWLPLVGVIALGAAMPAPALAAQYFSVASVQKALFPDAQEFVKRVVHLTPEQRRFIEAESPTRTPMPDQHIWEARAGGTLLGYVVVDQVYGKHEFITYATALAPDGAVKQIEIMDYRETYGYEVRNEKWRQQFVGKKFGAPVKVDADIQNIGGATLSCVHVTEGVRRVLAIYQAALKAT
jgi:Na+-translocating ferredoxin:NAD+ oxidoreductase RnfG subunit